MTDQHADYALIQCRQVRRQRISAIIEEVRQILGDDHISPCLSAPAKLSLVDARNALIDAEATLIDGAE
jgi:hypothetical protein